MIQKIIAFFKSNNKKQETKKQDKKEGDKEEEYIPSQFEIWRFYKKYLHFDYKQIIIKCVALFISSYLEAREPFILLQVKQSVANSDREGFKYAILEYMIGFSIKQVLKCIDVIFSYDSYTKIYQKVTKSILLHIFSLDIQYFEDNKVTEISQLIKQGSEQITVEINYSRIYTLIDQYIYYAGQIYFIYTQSPNILLTMVIFSFLLAILHKIFSKKQQNLEKELSQDNEFKQFAFDDVLTNIHVIKTFGTEKKEIERLNKIVDQNQKYLQESQYFQKMAYIIRNSYSSLLKIVIIIQIFLGFGLSGNKLNVANQLIEILSHIYSTLTMSTDIIDFFSSNTKTYFNNRKKYIGKVMKLFNEKPMIYQDFNNGLNNKIKLEGDIVFENVCFKYPVSKSTLSELNQKKQEEEKQNQENQTSLDRKQENISKQDLFQNENSDSSGEDLNPQQTLHTFKKSNSNIKDREYILEHISFSIQKGQFVAFVGTSGSGKSTIVKLIQRFYDVNSGSILFDGKNIKDVSLNQIRRSIGLVSQEPSLFDNDIEYNITYGCEDRKYTQDELRKICDMSGVSEFVFDEKRFPKGLKTLVGTKGQKLSGGQKQRISIARALIKKTKILILDEATSALDSESEHIVQQYIDKLVYSRGMTIITIAHRLSTILKSDKIFVMKRGQIKEQGTHNELLAQNGIYKKLIHHQINFQNKIEQQ